MWPYLIDRFGNPSSRRHGYGWEADEAVERARVEVAALIGARPREITFTSGATESDNLALKGVECAHLVTSPLEHRAVIDSARWLETRGVDVTWLPVHSDGVVRPEDVAAAIRAETTLVSVMHANNEIGVVQPIDEIGAVCRDQGAMFHSDAAQTAGHLRIDVNRTAVDMLSFTAHKLYGPKGIGALYVRRRRPRLEVEPLLHGGGHERGLRSGTLPVHQIVGFGAACALACARLEEDARHVYSLRERLRTRLFDALDDIYLNGALAPRLPGNLNVAFGGVEAEALMHALSGVAVSSGAACAQARLEPSHVLRALGLDAARVHGSLRFGVGRTNTEVEIDAVAQTVIEAVRALRRRATESIRVESVDLVQGASTHDHIERARGGEGQNADR